MGEGGIGKSSLAFKLINDCANIFDYIIPIYFDPGITFEKFLLEISKGLPIQKSEFNKENLENRRQILLNTLASSKHPLIFADNYENVSEILSKDVPTDDAIRINNFLESTPSNTSIILTSRHKNNLVGEISISVEGLEQEEGKELFIKIARKHFVKKPLKIYCRKS